MPGEGCSALAPGCIHPWVKLGSGPPLPIPWPPLSSPASDPPAKCPAASLPHFLLKKWEQLLVVLRVLLLKKHLTFVAYV